MAVLDLNDATRHRLDAHAHVRGRLERFGGVFATERLQRVTAALTTDEATELVRVLDAAYAEGLAKHATSLTGGAFRHV